MSDQIFDFSELRANLLENLSEENDENNRKVIVKTYLESIKKLPNAEIVSDFKKGLEWINVKQSLSLKKELKGKIVVLDFFTYCCINCMHILPDLKVLENQFSIEDGLVVIGVHSPKFSNEKETVNVTAAVKRYEISHAVVNDPEETMWEALGVRCWPTLVVIGPNGENLLHLMGEGHRALLQLFIDEAIKFYKSTGALSNHPLPQIQPFQHSPPSSAQPLLYPGKVAVAYNLVAIADTGHHRVIILDMSGVIQYIIGGPDSGFCDGSFSEVKFHSLQGITFYSKHILFVADTENHAIREINLTSCQVKTIVGNGKQGHERLGGKLWAAQVISSPWDVCIVRDHVLLIAMAGTHQIWALFLEDTVWWKNKKYSKGMCTAIAGSGREENRNNSYPMSAAFAQPSGLSFSSDLDCVFVADSESSTVRRLQLSDGQVLSVVGGVIDPRNLFGFGDVDGKGTEAKLQHPLGVSWCENEKRVYVADTYNHKVKCIDPVNKVCKTLTDINHKPFKFNEPSGLYIVGDNLYVADTNNHEIVVVNLKTKSSSKFVVQLPSTVSRKSEGNSKSVPVVCEKTVQLPPKGGTLNIKINLLFSDGISLTAGAPSKWILHIPTGENWSVTSDEDSNKTNGFQTAKEWDFKIEDLSKNGTGNISEKRSIKIDCYLFYCSKGICSSKKFAFNIIVNVDSSASGTTNCLLEYNITHD